MPIYEYQCAECGYQLEVLQKISDEPLKDCPQCGEPAMKKLVSAAAFRLKGGGWYETDFKSGDKKKNVHASDDATKSEGKSADKSTSSADSKSATPGATTKKPADSKN